MNSDIDDADIDRIIFEMANTDQEARLKWEMFTLKII